MSSYTRPNKTMSPRDQRIRYEGIRKVAKPWAIDKADLDRMCSEGMQWTKENSYNQKTFFKRILNQRLETFRQHKLVNSEGVIKLQGMISSNDKELSALGYKMIKSLLQQFKALI